MWYAFYREGILSSRYLKSLINKCIMAYKTYIFITLLMLSCSSPSSDMTNLTPVDIVELRPANKWLKFPVDEDTEIGWYPKVIEKDEREYIVIENVGQPQLLFFDTSIEKCIRKVTCHKEGPNGIGNAYDYYVKDWDEIYWNEPGGGQFLIRVNGKGERQGNYSFRQDINGDYLPPFKDVIFVDSLFYIQLYHYNHNQKEDITHVVAVLDTTNKTVKQLPFYHPTEPTLDDLYQMRLCVGDEDVNWLYDGKNFIYVFGQNDSIYVASPNHEKTEAYNAKSKYLKPAKYHIKEPFPNLNSYFIGCNQLQFYDRIYYDKYREVYYRLAYPESEVDPKENQRDIWSFGRRTCSIVILDKNFRIIGETLLPDYRYQNRSIVVLKDGLYICDSHYKREDYDENIWSFQQFDLVKKK